MGNRQRFLTKISQFVHSLDQAKILWNRMFNPEGYETFLEELRSSANYVRRAKQLYEDSIAKDDDKLHHEVRCVWHGRQGQQMTQALQLFFGQWVQPCIDSEPGHPIKHQCLEKLLGYLSREESTSQSDLDMVRAIVTGKLSRHPAIHGVLTACMSKLRQFAQGTSTMRNRHRGSVGGAACGR